MNISPRLQTDDAAAVMTGYSRPRPECSVALRHARKVLGKGTAAAAAAPSRDAQVSFPIADEVVVVRSSI